MRIHKDIVYDSRFPEICKLDIYLPENDAPVPVYMHIHGGGLVEGDKNGVGTMAQYLTDNGIALVSIDYRMYPNCRFPDYLNDAAAAAAWVLHQSGDYAKFTDLLIGGSSAGGYITMMLYFNPGYLANCGVALSDVSGWCFDAGQPTTHFNALKYEQGLDSRCVRVDEMAPFYYLTTAYTAPETQPHICIFCSDHDMVNRREQLEVLRTAMLHFGFPPEKLTFKVYEGTTHCSYCGGEAYFADLVNLVKKSVK